MNDKQCLDITAAILTISERSEKTTRDRYLKLRQLLIEDADQEKKKQKLKVKEI